MSTIRFYLAALLMAATAAASAASELLLDARRVAVLSIEAPESFADRLALTLDAQHDGEWVLQGNTLSWTHEIVVRGALALALQAEALQLPAGAVLSIGDEHWQGPLTLSPLFTRHQPGTRLLLHAEMPRGVASDFVFKVVEVQAAYRDPAAAPTAVGAKAGDACAVNFACAVDSTVERWGGAVVAITVLNTATCTATLMNNSGNDARPFLLTAKHCYSNSGGSDPALAAASIRVAWNAVATCGTPLDSAWGGGSLVTSGASHRAQYGDAWLVELNSLPPESVGLWYAGFDARDQAPAGPIIGLHHGSALQRQLLSSTTAPSRSVIGNFLGGIDILGWGFSPQLGGATPGASGSALFDAGGHVIGTLSTGIACDIGVPLVTYARLVQAWNGDGSRSGSLRPWLDPVGSGAPLAGKSFTDPVVPTSPTAPASPSTPSSGATGTASGGGGALGSSLLLMLIGFGFLRRKKKYLLI